MNAHPSRTTKTSSTAAAAVIALATIWLAPVAAAAQPIAIPVQGGQFTVVNPSVVVERMLRLGRDEFAVLRAVFELVNDSDRDWTHATVHVDLFDRSGVLLLKESTGHSFTFVVDSFRSKERRAFSFRRPSLVPAGTKKESIAISRLNFVFGEGRYAFSYVISLDKPKPNADLLYEDDVVGIAFAVGKSLGFTLSNKTEHPIKVDWHQVSYVDTDGSAHRVIHDGVRLLKPDQQMPPTFLPPGATLKELVCPSDRVRMECSESRMPPILPDSIASAVGLKGKNFSLVLPLEINGVVKSYNFVFSINDVR